MLRADARCPAADWLPSDVKAQLETLQHDVRSLNDYDAHIVDKVQLFLDATLGLINCQAEQHYQGADDRVGGRHSADLIASMYGMNFKYMPEFDWSWPIRTGLGSLHSARSCRWFKLRVWI